MTEEKYYGGNINYHSRICSFKMYFQRKEWYQKWYHIPVKDWIEFKFRNEK